MFRLTTFAVRPLMLMFAASALPSGLFAQSGPVITGQAAFADYTQQKPGVRRKITVADLPEPKPDESVDNGPSIVPRPEGAWPIAPKGFKVEMYAQGFREPRLMRTAPNGDIFLADSHGDKIMVLRGVGPDGKAQLDGDCKQHELRGGSWFSSPRFVNASYRNRFETDYRSSAVGFRLVREIAP